MSLSNYEVPRTKVDLDKKNSIEVRGLGLEDVSFLVRVHKDEVDALIDTFREKALSGSKAKQIDDIDPASLDAMVRDGGNDLIMGFLQQFPLLAANVIAVAVDEPESWQVARRLPMPKQVEALVEVARLTFEDREGFVKFVGNVTAVLKSVRPHAPRKNDKGANKKTGKSTGSTG